MKRFQISDQSNVPAKMSKTESDETVLEIIDVALDDNAPSMELYYVKGTDHVETAKSFVFTNDLPNFHIPHITQFLRKHFPIPRPKMPSPVPLETSIPQLAESAPAPAETAIPWLTEPAPVETVIPQLAEPVPMETVTPQLTEPAPMETSIAEPAVDPVQEVKEPEKSAEPVYPHNCDFVFPININVGRCRPQMVGLNNEEDIELAAKRFCQHYGHQEEMSYRAVELIKRSLPRLEGFRTKRDVPTADHIEPMSTSEPETPNPTVAVDPGYPKNCDYVVAMNMGFGRVEQLGYNMGEDMELAAKRFCQYYNHDEMVIPDVIKMIKRAVPAMQGFEATRIAADIFSTSAHVYQFPLLADKNHDLCPSGDDYPLTEPEVFPLHPPHPEKAVCKLTEFNNALPDHMQLSPREINTMIAWFLDSPICSPSDFCSGLTKALFWWPTENLLPIVDLLRLAVVNESCNAFFFPEEEGEMRTKIRERLIELLLSDAMETIKLVIFRVLCTAFKHPAGRNALCADHVMWMSAVARLLPTSGHQLQIVISKFVGNYAVVLFPNSALPAQCGPDSRTDILLAVIVILKRLTDVPFNLSVSFSEVAAQRFQAAIITLLWGSQDLVTIAKQHGILDVVDTFKDVFSEGLTKELAQVLIQTVQFI